MNAPLISTAGVIKAVRNVVDQIMPKLVGQDPGDQAAIDHAMIELDGTDNKGNLGEVRTATFVLS